MTSEIINQQKNDDLLCVRRLSRKEKNWDEADRITDICCMLMSVVSGFICCFVVSDCLDLYCHTFCVLRLYAF